MTDPQIDLQKPIGDRVEQSTCYMCACRCGINVHIKDGKIRYIEGNPDHPVNKGVLCAKGSAGIMQHYSPARLRKPLKRVGERGENRFEEIEWDEALTLASQWLAEARAKDPNRLAFFTGRDQSQSLTGWWAQQYGTVNYAAHGGFCSVNMAAAGLYTIGGSFWEFGEPDWEHSRYLMMWGVAEDHDSNPIKLGLSQMKANGAKIVVVNPVRSGYGAIADEWIGIRPGSDGLFAFALIHELLRTQQIDLDYLVRYANAHWLVIDAPGSANDGLFARDEAGEPLCFDQAAQSFERANATGISPAIVGKYRTPNDESVRPVFELLLNRYSAAEYSPEAVSERCGIAPGTIRRIARELADAAFKDPISLPIAWTDVHGQEHSSMPGRAVSFHAMRGISAHSNGFHTCRALHVLQLLLGAVDTPGSFRYQPPFPKTTPPAPRPGKQRTDNGSLNAAPLGFIHGPEDLLVDARGKPQRIDHAFSWSYPLAVHGMMHTVIRNAAEANPYPIDVLFMFMANMSWNSSMNTRQTMQWLSKKDADGNYVIPKIIYSDAYASEMVAYADLVLPDTTYLERWDCISLLDRPISDADGAADGIRHPVMAPDRDVRGFQSVLLDLGARLGLPGMLNADGSAKYSDYADYIVNHERSPGVGPLMGWRGEAGQAQGRGAVNPNQLEQYKANGSFWRTEIPESARYYKMANRDYLRWAKELGFVGDEKPVVLQLYSETLQKFRLAARGHGPHQPPESERTRVETYFDPLPIWYEPFESASAASAEFPLSAITQRPMFMYHAWGSQNAWLRQIASENALYVHPKTAALYGIQDGQWIELASQHAVMRAPCRLVSNVQPDTVWTWNAIGKRKKAWGLGADAEEASRGFLLNHVISDLLPDQRYANADPVTGQGAWFDLRVRIRGVDGPEEMAPALHDLPHSAAPPVQILRFGAEFREPQK